MARLAGRARPNSLESRKPKPREPPSSAGPVAVPHSPSQILGHVCLTSDGLPPVPKLHDMRVKPGTMGMTGLRATYVYLRRGAEKVRKLAQGKLAQSELEQGKPEKGKLGKGKLAQSKERHSLFCLQPVRLDKSRLACVVYHKPGQQASFAEPGTRFNCVVVLATDAAGRRAVYVVHVGLESQTQNGTTS